MPTSPPAAPPPTTVADDARAPHGLQGEASWFGSPLLDERRQDPGGSGRGPSDTPANGTPAQTPYFFRVYRAFLTARAALALMLLALLGGLWSMGTHPPSWVLSMALCYAVLAGAVWWLPSQRVPASSQQLTLRPRQALASVGVDLLFFTALHYLTGSGFNTQAMLVLPVLMAAVLMPRIMALGTAAVATLNLLAAANPQGQFVGVDFLPEHVDHGRAVAQAAGLTNIQFIITISITRRINRRTVRKRISHRDACQRGITRVRHRNRVMNHLTRSIHNT